MIWLFLLIALVILAEGARLRARLRAIPRLRESLGPDPAPPMTHRLLVAPGVTVLPPVERAARAFAAATGADLLDIVPANLAALQSLTLAQLVDPARLATDPFLPLGGAGHARTASFAAMRPYRNGVFARGALPWCSARSPSPQKRRAR